MIQNRIQRREFGVVWGRTRGSLSSRLNFFKIFAKSYDFRVKLGLYGKFTIRERQKTEELTFSDVLYAYLSFWYGRGCHLPLMCLIGYHGRAMARFCCLFPTHDRCSFWFLFMFRMFDLLMSCRSNNDKNNLLFLLRIVVFSANTKIKYYAYP